MCAKVNAFAYFFFFPLLSALALISKEENEYTKCLVVTRAVRKLTNKFMHARNLENWRYIRKLQSVGRGSTKKCT